MTEQPPIDALLEQVKQATTEALLDEGVLRYWQHDPTSEMHRGEPWAYTCGRTLYGRPELLVTGLGEAVSLNLLTELGDCDAHPDTPLATSVGRVAFIRAETGLLHAAYAVFGPGFSALQAIWEGAGEQPLHPIGGLIMTDPYPTEETT